MDTKHVSGSRTGHSDAAASKRKRESDNAEQNPGDAQTELDQQRPRKRIKDAHKVAEQHPAPPPVEDPLVVSARTLRAVPFTVTEAELRGKDLLVAACDGESPHITNQVLDLSACYRDVAYAELLPDCEVARQAGKDKTIPESGLYAILSIFTVFCTCEAFRDRIRPLCDPVRFVGMERRIKAYFDVFILGRDAEKRFSKEMAKDDVPSFGNWLQFAVQLMASYCSNSHSVLTAYPLRRPMEQLPQRARVQADSSRSIKKEEAVLTT
jgi:hypothetical protein